MKDADKMSTAELRREVKELREGKCRNNCRTTKELQAEIERLQDALFEIRELSVDTEDLFVFDLIWDVAHKAMEGAEL